MPSDEYREFSYLNRITVRVAFGQHPMEPPDEVWETGVHAPVIPDGQTWSEVPYLEAISPVTWEDDGEYRRPYTVEVSKSHTSWGADGAGATILFYIANQGLSAAIGGVTWAAIVAAFKRISEFSDYNGEPLEREEAIEHAKWRIERAYEGVSSDSLRLVGDSHDREHERWTLEFKTADGVKYTVVLGVVDGLPITARIARKAP